MSVIAVKVKKEAIHIAADTLVCYGTKKIHCQKLKDFPQHNKIVGAVGDADVASLFFAYVEKEALSLENIIIEMAQFYKKEGVEENDMLDLLIVNKQSFEASFFYTYTPEKIEKYGAIGAGAPCAYGVFYKGGRPVEAVRAACEYDTSCGLPIETMTIYRGDTKVYCETFQNKN